MKAVLFDLDGTLADTRKLYAEAYTHAFEAELGAFPPWEEFLARQPTSESRFLHPWHGPEVATRLHDGMLARYAELAPRLHGPLYQGVEDVVARTREAGLVTGIVTGKSRRGFEISAEHVRLEGYAVVVVEDDVPEPKPDPAGLRLALETLGLEGADTVYVGDAPHDLDAARAVGAQPAAALWGRHPDHRDPASVDADVWALSEPRELLARLGLERG